MTFNSAVFYDIENLLKGYGFSAQTLSSLSLREILDSATETGRLSAIAIQRAYANWSDPRLGVMRGEINELGIEPVQVFGFSRDQKKNAADIQLAIDAIDLAHIRPSIEVFVIVSGDGGFASLAKKLHEYGKTVVGCAYPSTANRIFHSVCDEFVSIADPEGMREATPGPRASDEGPQITTPLVRRMTRTVKRAASTEREVVVAKAKEVLRWMEGDNLSRSALDGHGLHLSVVGEAIRAAVPDFDPGRVGFAKFVDFLQYACANTKLHVLRFYNGSVALGRRSSTDPGAEPLPDLGPDYLHSVENYRSVLGTGFPIFRLPDPQSLYEVATWVAHNPPRDVGLGTAIETVANSLGESVSEEAVKRALLCFISAGIFDRHPEGAPLGEQNLTLKAGLANNQEILDTLEEAVRTKIQDAVSEVRDEIIEEVLPTCA